MPRVGRNDPCPCGSGKKYKHCHMLLDRAQQSEALTARQDYADLLDALFEFLQNPSLVLDVKPAFALFWNGDYGLGAMAALDPKDLFRFFEWFIFDYPTLQDKKRVVGIFQEERGPSLSEGVRAMLGQWAQAPLSLYRVDDAVPGRSLHLCDLLLEGEERVQDDEISQSVTSGDLVLGRLLEVRNGLRLSASPIVLPPALQAEMVESMERYWSRYQEANFGADRLTFLRDSSYLLNHVLLRQVRADGDRPRALSKYYDPAQVLCALERARGEEQQATQERQRLLDKEIWADQPEPEFKTIADGNLLLPSDPKPPDPEADEKTFAGGKLILP